MVVVVMGVSGSGKTTVGRALAQRLGWPFHEGDDLHPPTNIHKMARREPLTDDDRRPWLERIRDLASDTRRRGGDLVVTCSCLKRAYRDIVRAAAPHGRQAQSPAADLRFVHLAIDREAATARIRARRGHFFDATLVASQFEALEPPQSALILDATRPVTELVEAALAGLALEPCAPG